MSRQLLDVTPLTNYEKMGAMLTCTFSLIVSKKRSINCYIASNSNQCITTNYSTFVFLYALQPDVVKYIIKVDGLS